MRTSLFFIIIFLIGCNQFNKSINPQFSDSDKSSLDSLLAFYGGQCSINSKITDNYPYKSIITFELTDFQNDIRSRSITNGLIMIWALDYCTNYKEFYFLEIERKSKKNSDSLFKQRFKIVTRDQGIQHQNMRRELHGYDRYFKNKIKYEGYYRNDTLIYERRTTPDDLVFYRFQDEVVKSLIPKNTTGNSEPLWTFGHPKSHLTRQNNFTDTIMIDSTYYIESDSMTYRP